MSNKLSRQKYGRPRKIKRAIILLLIFLNSGNAWPATNSSTTAVQNTANSSEAKYFQSQKTLLSDYTHGQLLQSCHKSNNSGDSYTALRYGVNAWNNAKANNEWKPRIEIIQCIVNAITIGGAANRDGLSLSQNILKELEIIRERLLKRLTSEEEYALEYLKGQVYGWLYFNNQNDSDRRNALKSLFNSINIAKNLGLSNEYIVVALTSLGAFYDPQNKDSFNTTIKNQIYELLANADSLPHGHRFATFRIAGWISEKDNQLEEALAYLREAENKAIRDSDKERIRDDILRVKRLMNKLGDKESAILSEKRTIDLVKSLWNQLITLEYGERQVLLKDRRWGSTLAEGYSYPRLSSLFDYELNIRNLALEAEKAIANRQQARMPEILNLSDIKKSFYKDDLLILLGTIETNFTKETTPYRDLKAAPRIRDYVVTNSIGNSSSYFAAFVTSDQEDFRWLGTSSLTDRWVELLLDNINQNTEESQAIFDKLSDRLAQDLIPPTGKNNIYIVPYGAFARIPIASMLNIGAKRISYLKPPRIILLSSAKQILALDNNKIKPKLSFSIFSNPQLAESSSTRIKDYEAKGAWSSLPFTSTEGRNLKQIFKNATVLESEKFSITEFQKIAQKPGVIHLATHAFYRPPDKASGQNNEQAGIVFSGANSHSNLLNNPSILTSQAISAMDMNHIEMLTISGCESAKGQSFSIEAWSGLQRALMIAGVKSSLSALWKVDDAATAEFMTRFYQRLKLGGGRADALAATQKEFRDGISGKPDEWRRPYYWAAWQLVGDWRPIKGL